MLDLTDTAIIIPLRLDSPDRLRNLTTVVSYFQKYTNTHIYIIEDDASIKCPASLSQRPGVQHRLFFNSSHLFRKMQSINVGVRSINVPYFSVYDVDVLVKVKQLEETLNLLRTKQADVVYPYDGRFMNVPATIVPSIVSSVSLDGVNDDDMRLGYGMPGVVENDNSRPSFGGAVFFNKDKFIEAGMANENFVSYGPEDAEFYVRFNKLGYIIKRVNGPIYHLHHSRGINSREEHEFVATNHEEYKSIVNMSREQLTNYVSKWSWHKKDLWQ